MCMCDMFLVQLDESKFKLRIRDVYIIIFDGVTFALARCVIARHAAIAQKP